MGVDQANSASSKASKGSMHGTLPQHLAVDAVIGGGGNGSDHVSRVNVLDVHALQSQVEHDHLTVKQALTTAEKHNTGVESVAYQTGNMQSGIHPKTRLSPSLTSLSLMSFRPFEF